MDSLILEKDNLEKPITIMVKQQVDLWSLTEEVQPSYPSELTVSVEKHHSNDHEKGVVVELPVRVLRPGKTPSEVPHPHGNHDDRNQTKDLRDKDPASEEPQGPSLLTIHRVNSFVLLHSGWLKQKRDAMHNNNNFFCANISSKIKLSGATKTNV